MMSLSDIHVENTPAIAPDKSTEVGPEYYELKMSRGARVFISLGV